MKTLFKGFASFIFVALLASVAFGQFSRQNAEDLVLNSILLGTEGKVDVYVSTTSVSGQIVLIDNDTILCPYQGNWVFFVDDHPYSGWYHDCRYIFVNDQTGDYSIVNAGIFPKNQSSDYEMVAGISYPEPAMISVGGSSLMDALPPNDHYFAVIVCVIDNQANWNDVSLVYNTLIQKYGYKKENIFVHYSFDGTSPLYGSDLDDPTYYSNDLDYPATHPAIDATFNELAGNYNNNPDIPELGHGDLLSVFFIDVPVNTPDKWAFWADNQGEFMLLVNSSVTANKLAGIDCAQMLLTFSINSGETIAAPFMDFTNPVDCESRYVHTATSANEAKHYEQYITGGNYSEYLFYWSAAVRGFYPDAPFNEPWTTGYAVGSFPFNTIPGLEDHGPDYNLDWNSDYIIQMGEAFYYANDQNTWSAFGYSIEQLENPKSWDLNPFIQLLNEPDVVTLAGYAGDIFVASTITVQGNLVIGGPLKLSKVWPMWFHFGDQSEIYLVNPSSKIVIMDGITVYAHSGSTFHSTSIMNEILVLGTLKTMGDNVSFLGLNDVEWGGFYIGELGVLEIDNVNIHDCKIVGPAENLSISFSNLENCEISVTKGDVYFNECNLISSSINVAHSSGSDRIVSIVGNQMNGLGLSVPAINLTRYSKFKIMNNVIQQYLQGISLNYCGSSTEMNTILDNNIYSNTGSGIRIYWSYANILNKNRIANNGYGIQILDRSVVSIVGNDNATYPEHTNFLLDCNSYELYSTQNSFPYPFVWNAIIDQSNINDALIYTVMEPSGSNKVFKIGN